MHPQPLEERPAAGRQRLAVDPASSGQGLPAHEDVLRDREIREQRGLLVDHRDAGGAGRGRVLEHDRLAVEQQPPCVRTVHPGEDLDQRRLPGPVLTDQGVGLPRAQLQLRATQGGDGAEGLAHVLQGEDDRAGGGWRRSVLHGDRLQIMKRFTDVVAQTIGTC
jgi:hypothetical protein